MLNNVTNYALVGNCLFGFYFMPTIQNANESIKEQVSSICVLFLSKAIDNIKFWNDDYNVIIGVDVYGNKKMVNYLKKNCDFLSIDNSEVTITLDDIMNHFDELHDALS